MNADHASPVGSAVADTRVDTARRAARDRLPKGPGWLATGTFALGTEAFIIAGVLPQISEDLSISASTAGLLVAMFALTYGLSAPFVTAAVAHHQPKTVLRVVMVLFMFTNLAAAAAPTFAALLVARMTAGVFAAAFAPAASATASELVDPAFRGRALALVFGGMSLAMVTGVPLGTVLSNIGSWRTTFVFVASLGLVAAIGIHRNVPEVRRSTSDSPTRPFAALSTPRVSRCLVVSVIVRAGDFAVFTYIASIVTDFYGNPTVTVPIVLLANGSAGWFGTTLSGRLTDSRGSAWTRRLAISGSCLGLAVLAVASVVDGPLGPVVATPALLIWSTAAWGFGPPQQARLLALAPNAPNAALALNASATQLGIGLGGLVGAATVAVATLAVIPAVGVTFTLVAAVIAGFRLHMPASVAHTGHPINHSAAQEAPR